MRTQSRRKFGWAMAGALAFIVGAPSLSQAQQTGMFPLAPIRRERVPCQMEDPVYRLYRHEYFGYHPTCWRRFPSGWGCPSPEAPNQAASFRELPLEKPPADTNPEGQPGPDGMTPPDRGEGTPTPGTGPRQPAANPLPALPPSATERSPFDLDTKPNAPQGARPRSLTPPAPEQPSPPTLGAELPPAREPSSTETPAAAGASAATSQPNVEQPLLALPDPTASNAATTIPTPNAFSGNPDPGPGPQASAPPAQAPRRQGPISSLFNNLLRR